MSVMAWQYACLATEAEFLPYVNSFLKSGPGLSPRGGSEVAGRDLR